MSQFTLRGFPLGRIVRTACTLTSCHNHLSKSATALNSLFSNMCPLCFLDLMCHPHYFISIFFFLLLQSLFVSLLTLTLLFFLSETISGFSNRLLSTASITDMGRSEEGGERGRRRLKKEMKPKKGLFLFEVACTNVSYLSFPLPCAEIIVLQNCIPSEGEKKHTTHILSPACWLYTSVRSLG